jgi:hypothetical protein
MIAAIQGVPLSLPSAAPVLNFILTSLDSLIMSWPLSTCLSWIELVCQIEVFTCALAP